MLSITAMVYFLTGTVLFLLAAIIVGGELRLRYERRNMHSPKMAPIGARPVMFPEQFEKLREEEYRKKL